MISVSRLTPKFSKTIVQPYLIHLRHISEEQIGACPDQVAELFEKTIKSASRKKSDSDQPRILTTRREAISLYREILRYSNLFMWRDQNGKLFRDIIRESARKEFDDARFEIDPEIVNKLIITGRDCVYRTVEAFVKKREEVMAAEQNQPPRMF
mmetsp:Transcript_8325/g.16029  ORF Transcript_8325/g.16029 Transcript_8325/m.16029 type:complete len:154 (-) Transcript_8325:65-526(-)